MLAQDARRTGLAGHELIHHAIARSSYFASLFAEAVQVFFLSAVP